MSRRGERWAALPLACTLVLLGHCENLKAQQVANKVSASDCNAFRHYILQEAREFGNSMSGTFLTAASRFTKAGCVPRDAEGEIQLITETTQDAESLLTARHRMGKIDILAESGVSHCHRPRNGKCPRDMSVTSGGR